jgi:hypothetical protein
MQKKNYDTLAGRYMQVRIMQNKNTILSQADISR